MSTTGQNLTKDVQTALIKIDDEVDKLPKRSGSISEKPFDLSTDPSIRPIMNKDRLPAIGNRNKQESTNLKDNKSLINPDFDKSIKLEDQFTHSSNHDNDKVQSILRALKGNDSKKDEEKHDSCADECICKIKEALRLIVEEVKKVDATISGLKVKIQCPYTPNSDDKKKFAKSVEKNSAVCHVIIDELKKQRREINEMLEMYDVSSKEFLKLEVTVKKQRENIEQIETILESLTKTVKDVKADVAKRHESYLLKLKSRRTRVETREEILKVFINWIMSLDAKRFDDREVIDSIVKEAIEDRNKDRATLTLAIRQLQEVKRIEILLMTQHAATTKGNKDESNVSIARVQQATMPVPFCKCPWPIDRVPIVSGQCDNATANCVSRVNPGAFFNINSSRCAGGADHIGAENTLGTVMENGNGVWYPRIPIGHNNMRAPTIRQRRVPIKRRQSPTNSPRRQRRNIRNVNLDNSEL